MVSQLPDSNPYVAPPSADASAPDIGARSSRVTSCTLLGALIGLGTSVVLQLLLVGTPIPLTVVDSRYIGIREQIDLLEITFGAAVVSLFCAILGSVVGALMDTLDHSAPSRITDRGPTT